MAVPSRHSEPRERGRGRWPWIALAALLVPAGASCTGGRAPPARPQESAADCSARLHALVTFVAALPARTVASVTRADLPVSTLGALPGPGPVLEISGATATLDGAPVLGGDLAARTDPALYVAASAETDVQTLRAYLVQVRDTVALRLLVRVPKLTATALGAPNVAAADEPSTHLLLEASPVERERIAERGYASLAECPALTGAVQSVHGRDPRRRWPALQPLLVSVLPSCDCGHVDTTRLQSLIAAEQRASGAALGWVPLSFLRDERCGASMPLRSMRKLMQQIETFDAEFAGGWQKDALGFTDVVTNDRLRVYFCSALPGETLAAKERARATLYLRVPGTASCDPWELEPLAPGSPMGTWRRAASAGRGTLAYHYWQAAEELRVFGPVDAAAPSLPTDARDWACEQTHHLAAIDDDSIELSDGGRWFFDDAACRRAKETVARAAPCVAARGAGAESAAPAAASAPSSTTSAPSSTTSAPHQPAPKRRPGAPQEPAPQH